MTTDKEKVDAANIAHNQRYAAYNTPRDYKSSSTEEDLKMKYPFIEFSRTYYLQDKPVDDQKYPLTDSFDDVEPIVRDEGYGFNPVYWSDKKLNIKTIEAQHDPNYVGGVPDPMRNYAPDPAAQAAFREYMRPMTEGERQAWAIRQAEGMQNCTNLGKYRSDSEEWYDTDELEHTSTGSFNVHRETQERFQVDFEWIAWAVAGVIVAGLVIAEVGPILMRWYLKL